MLSLLNKKKKRDFWSEFCDFGCIKAADDRCTLLHYHIEGLITHKIHH